MVLVYNGSGLRMPSKENRVDFSQLQFYITNNLHGYFFCRLNDSTILKLVKTTSEKNYDFYEVSLKNYIDLENGETNISLIHIDEKSILHVTDSVSLNCDFTNFQTGTELSLLSEVNTQISEMTKLNIEIYKDIKEVAGR